MMSAQDQRATDEMMKGHGLRHPAEKVQKVAPASVEVTLKDGRAFNCTGMTITTLKHLRRTGGEITVTIGEEKFVVQCKHIRGMRNVNPLPQ